MLLHTHIEHQGINLTTLKHMKLWNFNPLQNLILKFELKFGYEVEMFRFPLLLDGGVRGLLFLGGLK